MTWRRKLRQGQSDNRGKRHTVCFFCLLTAFFVIMCIPDPVQAKEKVQIEFFYENVCASCEGDADFYDIYGESLTDDERESLNAEISTYNIFLDSCRTYYEDVTLELDIPKETSLPVLVIGDQWVSGYEAMGGFLRSFLAEGETKGRTGNQTEAGTEDGDPAGRGTREEDIIAQVEAAQSPVILLFTTNACEDCEEIKEWIGKNREFLGGEILEYNIIDDNCLDLLKRMFRERQIEEKNWEVPAVFCGNGAVTGKDVIPYLESETLQRQGNEQLTELLKQTAKQKTDDLGAAGEDKGVNLLTLAGTGLLAGLNPCSISMLLMLLSLILSEKASVFKNGLLYLGGKYAAYFAIGIIIYLSASQISDQALGQAGRVINMILVVLFGIAGILYLHDAVKVYRQDYGHIRTQLPVGLRRMNHRLIRRTLGKSGAIQPLLILGLGVAISLGEFFCTGQIYMASITYLLKDRIHGVWVPFLVYVTAMSIPAFVMILVIQRTRNTERVSDFMLRHLGAVKLLNAALFLGFMVYFLFR